MRDSHSVADVNLKCVCDCEGRDGTLRPNGVKADAWKFSRPGGRQHAHRNLRGRVARRRADPRAIRNGHWCHRKHVRQGSIHVRDDFARQEEGSTHVEMVHQVKALLLQRLDTEAVVSRSVIYEHVDATKLIQDLLNSLRNLCWSAQVAWNRKALATDCIDLLHDIREHSWAP